MRGGQNSGVSKTTYALYKYSLVSPLRNASCTHVMSRYIPPRAEALYTSMTSRFGAERADLSTVAALERREYTGCQ
jgi:hypothetical protein